VPDITQLVTILRESQLANEVVSARKIGFPLDSEGFGSSFLVDDFMYNNPPSQDWFLEGANQSMPTDVVGGRVQVDDTGDGVRVSVCKTTNVLLPVNSPNQVIVRFRSKQVIDNLNTHQFIGLVNTLPSGNPLTNPTDGVFFRASNGGSGVVWEAITRAFNVESSLATSVIADLDSDHTFEIEVINNIAQFFIDGLLQATLTTNIPSVGLRMAMGAIGRDATPFGVQLDSALIWNTR